MKKNTDDQGKQQELATHARIVQAYDQFEYDRHAFYKEFPENAWDLYYACLLVMPKPWAYVEFFRRHHIERCIEEGVEREFNLRDSMRKVGGYFRTNEELIIVYISALEKLNNGAIEGKRLHESQYTVNPRSFIRWAMQQAPELCHVPEYLHHLATEEPDALKSKATNQTATALRRGKASSGRAADIGAKTWGEIEIKAVARGIKYRRNGSRDRWSPAKGVLTWEKMGITARNGVRYWDLFYALCRDGGQVGVQKEQKRGYGQVLYDLNEKMRVVFGLTGQAFHRRRNLTQSTFAIIQWVERWEEE